MALLPLICDDIVSLVEMASLLSSSWHCCPHQNGVFVIIDVQASLLSSRWRCCLCCNGALAVEAQASSPLLQWDLLPLLQWHLCRSQVSIVIKLAFLPL
jgi:hypothetical protein